MQSRLASPERGTSVPGSPVYRRFEEQARTRGTAVAVLAQDVSISYAQLLERAERAGSLLASVGVGRGDRLAILAENRSEFLELQLAAAKLGAIVACQNWRLASAELQHCLRLVTPRVLFVSSRHRERLRGVEHQIETLIELGPDYESRLPNVPTAVNRTEADPEDGLVILYTSGTTGFPKAATISQRALVARMEVWRTDFGFDERDGFLAWSPLFHMAANDQSIAALMSGGTVILENGFEPERIAHLLARHRVGWFLLVPGIIDPMIACLAKGGPRPLGVKVVGSMADLVTPESVREITRLVGAPYLNSFGATETGMPPLSKGTISIGGVPASLSKQPSSSCEIRLVTDDWRDAQPGEPGEVAMRGPTLFSGYWTPQGFNRSDFSEDGFFRMGDVFRRNRDGSYDFVDRAKYLIKSGGENIYPAEIERVLLAAPHVREACVIRRRDEKWGEVPVAFVATDGNSVDAKQLQQLCKQHLAGYKCPREIVFVDLDSFPRSTTGKIMRHEMEKRLDVPGESSQASSLARLHQRMLLIRAAEESAGRLFAAGEIPGFIHLSIGQEAVPVGVTAALRREDTVSSTHRGHGHALAKGLSLQGFLLELLGKADGVCGGHGGSIHVADLSVGMLGANGIVGGGLPLAVGSALAHRVKGNDNIAVAFFGDGALAEGAFHECVNLAVLWRLPVLFACENNGWAEFTPSSDQIAFDLSRLVAAFDLPFSRVDGNDVESVAKAAEEAVAAMRREPHPRVLELTTVRARGHFEGDPQKYRENSSKTLPPDTDPIARSRKRLLALGYDDAALDAMRDAAYAEVESAVREARNGREPTLERALETVYAGMIHE